MKNSLILLISLFFVISCELPPPSKFETTEEKVIIQGCEDLKKEAIKRGEVADC